MSIPKTLVVLTSLLASVYFLSSCDAVSESDYVHLEDQAQGTTFSITHDGKSDFSNSVDSLFRLIDKSMSVWDERSIVSAVNAGQNVELDEHFVRVFNVGKNIFNETGGMFDMTVGPLVRRWGFSFKKGIDPPNEGELIEILGDMGMDKVAIEGNRLTKENASIELDFNAIAQGYTVDLIADFLEKNGVQNYMVEIGGEVKAKGENERGTVWNIAIDKPVTMEKSGGQRQLQCIVPLRNQSLVTSGSYRKFVERDGRKYSHAINPKTGQPVQHNLLSVTVLAQGCMEADAYATAFLVMGLEEAKQKATELGLEVYCIFEKEDGSFGVYASKGFEHQDIKE